MKKHIAYLFLGFLLPLGTSEIITAAAHRHVFRVSHQRITKKISDMQGTIVSAPHDASSTCSQIAAPAHLEILDAAWLGDVKYLKKHLNTDTAQFLTAKTDLGNTALERATRSGQYDTVLFLCGQASYNLSELFNSELQTTYLDVALHQLFANIEKNPTPGTADRNLLEIIKFYQKRGVTYNPKYINQHYRNVLAHLEIELLYPTPNTGANAKKNKQKREKEKRKKEKAEQEAAAAADQPTAQQKSEEQPGTPPLILSPVSAVESHDNTLESADNQQAESQENLECKAPDNLTIAPEESEQQVSHNHQSNLNGACASLSHDSAIRQKDNQEEDRKDDTAPVMATDLPEDVAVSYGDITDKAFQQVILQVLKQRASSKPKASDCLEQITIKKLIIDPAQIQHRIILEAARNGDIEYLKKQHPRALMHTDSKGDNALSHATNMGHLETVQFLCQKGRYNPSHYYDPKAKISYRDMACTAVFTYLKDPQPKISLENLLAVARYYKDLNVPLNTECLTPERTQLLKKYDLIEPGSNAKKNKQKREKEKRKQKERLEQEAQQNNSSVLLPTAEPSADETHPTPEAAAEQAPRAIVIQQEQQAVLHANACIQELSPRESIAPDHVHIQTPQEASAQSAPRPTQELTEILNEGIVKTSHPATTTVPQKSSRWADYDSDKEEERKQLLEYFKQPVFPSKKQTSHASTVSTHEEEHPAPVMADRSMATVVAAAEHASGSAKSYATLRPRHHTQPSLLTNKQKHKKR